MVQKGVSIDVERVIEQPEIYMLGRSKASVVDQGSYNQARIDDLQSLTTKLQTQQGVAVTEFLDKQNGRAASYSLTDHYRSTSLAEVYLKLQHCWEKCFEDKIELPAVQVKHYTSEGSLDHTTTYTAPPTDLEEQHQSVGQSTVQLPSENTLIIPNPSTDTRSTTTTSPEKTNLSPTETNQEAPSSLMKPQSPFHTTIARTLTKMLPDEHRVISQLDNLRSRIKRLKTTKQHPPKHMNTQYTKIILELKVKVEKWYQHAVQNKANPPPKENQEQYKCFQREQKLLHNAKTILREFKIAL